MKRFLTILAAMLTGVSVAEAQSLEGVTVESYTMERSGDYVVVDMDLNFAELKVKGVQSVMFTPHIVRDTMSVALRSIGVNGRNRHFYYLRNEDKALTDGEDIVFRSNEVPDVVAYHAMVPFESWMDGCQLVFERSDCGCNNIELGREGAILVDRFPLEPYRPTQLYLRPQAEKSKVRELSGSAFVDFPVSKMDIRPDYRNNIAELSKITSIIDSIKGDSDATITAISIKGYASPESSYLNNTRLAKGRTEALKEYVEQLYNFDEDFITTSYEPEDWAGLERFVVASHHIRNKSAILSIIRKDEDADIKEWRIKGEYPEDYQFLYDYCYPSLRHSDYVVQYEVRQYSNPKEIEEIMNTAPQKLSLEEFYILAETYEVGSAELDELWEIAVRMYPNDAVANFNAANSAMDKGDYKRAMRYLDKAGDMPEVHFSRGCIEVLQENYIEALPHLEEAMKQGVEEAAAVYEAVSNHWRVTRAKR